MANGQKVQGADGNGGGVPARRTRIQGLQEILLGRKEEFERALSGLVKPETYVQVILTAITENETLAQCSGESILLSSLKAAQAGLRLDGRQAALIPFRDNASGRMIATFMPMVQGVLDLISRSPGVAKVEARAVREGDEFRYHYGISPDLHHIPATGGTKDRPVTHAYAVVWWKNGAPPTFEVLDRDEIEAARQVSRAPNSPAWTKWYGEMARKTAVHRISKYVDLAPETARHLAAAMDAEFDVGSGAGAGGGTFAENASQRVRSQLDDVSRNLMARAADRAADAPDPGLYGAGSNDAGDDLHPDELRTEIWDEIRAQRLTESQARAAARFAVQGDEVPVDDQGDPAMERCDGPTLRKILDHLRSLGPGFPPDDDGNGGQEAPQGAETPQEPADAPAAVQDAAGPAPEPAAEAEPDRWAAALQGAGSVDPLACRKIGQGDAIHLVDPQVASSRENPPKCIGCGREAGAAAKARGTFPTDRAADYCGRALDAAEARFGMERIPEKTMRALLARSEAAGADDAPDGTADEAPAETQTDALAAEGGTDG